MNCDSSAPFSPLGLALALSGCNTAPEAGHETVEPGPTPPPEAVVTHAPSDAQPALFGLAAASFIRKG